MKKFLFVAAAASALALSAVSSVQASGFSSASDYGHPNVFVGIDALYWDAKGEGMGPRYNGAGARLRAGVSLTPFWGLEIHGAAGNDDTNDGAKHEFRTLGSALVRFSVPVAHDVNIYALGGYSEVKARHTTATGDSAGFTERGGSYGAGVEIPLFDNASAQVELMRYLDSGAYEFNTAGAGLTYRF